LSTLVVELIAAGHEVTNCPSCDMYIANDESGMCGDCEHCWGCCSCDASDRYDEDEEEDEEEDEDEPGDGAYI
jgi:hypothetical protein